MNEQLCLVGIMTLTLEDQNGNPVKIVRVKNQITEPFARYLLAGNLALCDVTARGHQLDSNPISRLLYSYPYLKRTDPTDLNDNLKQGYQITQATSGTGLLSMYLLSQPVSVTGRTIFPPYFDSSLRQNSTLEYDGDPLIVFYGNAADIEDSSIRLEQSKELSGWSGVRTNPAVISAYRHTGGAGVIRSVVMGIPQSAPTAQIDSYIKVEQSLAALPRGWDNAWEPVWEDEDSRTITENTVAGQYLTCPFLRSAWLDYKYGDGLYAVGATDGIISFYDYGSGIYEANTTAELERHNGITGELYTTVAENFVAPVIAGGFAIGNGKAIRVNKGNEEFDDEGNCIGRSFVIHYQSSLTNPGVPSTAFIESPMIYATDGTVIPETIYLNCNPVMVARRGKDEEEDIIEVFISLGVGEFTETTDSLGFHPGGQGVEVHKFTLFVHDYRVSAAPLLSILADSPDLLVYHGRVAVYPFAVGGYGEFHVQGMDALTAGEGYVAGSYDAAQDVYYLPITHLLNGCRPLNWTYDPSVPQSLKPILCASPHLQPGMKIERIDYEWIQECLLGLNEGRYLYLATSEGVVPRVVNHRQRNAVTVSMVLSAVNLPEPLEKTEQQRLVVQYSYAFEIYPGKPPVPNFAATGAETTIILQFIDIPSGCMAQLHRSQTAEFVEFQTISLGGVQPQGAFGYTDYNVTAGNHYYYRFRLWDGMEYSEWAYADAVVGAEE